jgi:hypothetical protein
MPTPVLRSDGTWGTAVDLERGQPSFDPAYAAATLAYTDPTTGAVGCDFPPPTPAPKVTATAASSRAGKLTQAKDTVQAQGYLLWDGRQFRGWYEFRRWLVARGGDVAEFKQRHPQAAEDLEVLG